MGSRDTISGIPFYLLLTFIKERSEIRPMRVIRELAFYNWRKEYILSRNANLKGVIMKDKASTYLKMSLMGMK